MSRTVKLPQSAPKFAKEALRLFAQNSKVTACNSVRDAARRVLRRLLATEITRYFPTCFHALEGLPVTLTVFDEVTVSFRLHFTETYHGRRTVYVNDFSDVVHTMIWLEHQMKALDALAALQTEKYRINEEQKEYLEDIKKGSAQGKAGFEKALSDLRRLLNDN